MRRTIHKAFLAWNFDKEEKWLNEMAAKGLAVVSVGFCKYEFEDCEPGEYKVCLQFLENNYNAPESQKYIEFLESTGAEHIGSYMRWVYFRKKTALGDFELFSDNASRIKHLSALIGFIAVITVLNLIVGIFSFVNIALGIWGIFGSIRLMKKRKIMKQDSRLFE